MFQARIWWNATENNVAEMHLYDMFKIDVKNVNLRASLDNIFRTSVGPFYKTVKICNS